MSETSEVQLFQGRVTHVIDPFNFWAQVGTEHDFEMFQWLEDELYNFCESIGCIRIAGRLENIDSGGYVLVKHNTVWYRAEVARIDSDKRKLDIVYVDYGDSDMVSIDQVCAACPMLFSMLKPQAVKCRLAGITPLAKNWTSRGINYFKELTKGKIFQTAIVREDTQFMYHEVSLYTSDKEGRSLAHILMQEEMGIASDKEVPEFKRDVKSELPESYLENFSYDTDDLLTSDYTNSPVGCDQSDGRDSVKSTNQQSFNINLYNMSESSNHRSDNNSPHNSSNRRLYNASPYEMTNIINSRYYGDNQQAANTTYTTGFYSDSDSSSVTSHKQPNNPTNQIPSNKQPSGLTNQHASNRYVKESRRLYMNDNASNSTEPLSGISTPLNYSTDFASGDETYNSQSSFQNIYTNAWSTAEPVPKQDSAEQTTKFWTNFPSEEQIKMAPASIWSNNTAANGDHINNIWSTNNGADFWSAVPKKMEEQSKFVEPPSPEIIIPGFNLSTIMKTKSACPDEIQEVRDVERRVTTKSKVADDMEQIYEELEKDSSKDAVSWGMSDLNIGTRDTSQPPDVYDNIKSQIESISPMNTSQYKPSSTVNNPTPPSTSQYSSQYTPPYPASDQQPFSKKHRFYQKAKRPSPSKQNISSPKLNSRQQMLEAVIQEDSYKPVVKLGHSEQAEYKLSKEIEKVLKTLETEEDPAIICSNIHYIVSPENDVCEANVLSVCLETIIDQAVIDKENTEKLLVILDSYSHCNIFGPCIEFVIEKLTKTSNKTSYKEMCIVLVKLLHLSKQWPKGVSDPVQMFILSMVKLWITFDKETVRDRTEGHFRGRYDDQTVSELYIDCLENVWLIVSEFLIDEYPAKYQYYIEKIEEKFLADGLRSAYRAKLFGMYKSSLAHQQINLAPSTQSNPTTDSVCYVDSAVLKSEVTTQTDRVGRISRSVQTEDNEEDIQVPDEWWLREQYHGDESLGNYESEDISQSSDTRKSESKNLYQKTDKRKSEPSNIYHKSDTRKSEPSNNIQNTDTRNSDPSNIYHKPDTRKSEPKDLNHRRDARKSKFKDFSQSSDSSFDHMDENLVRVSSFSEIYRLEDMKHSRSNSPLARSDTSQESHPSLERPKSPKSVRHGIESPLVTRNVEVPYEEEFKTVEVTDVPVDYESKMAFRQTAEREEDLLDNEFEESDETWFFDSQGLNGKSIKEDNSKSADLFTPLFEKQSKKKKSQKSTPKSWADCVKKENMEPDSRNLHSDHLKHLAIQTLKSGVLKGKNVQARRQLSSEELKVPVKTAPEGLPSESTRFTTPPKPVSELKFVPFVPPGKFIPPKRVPTNLTTTKSIPVTSKPTSKLTPLKPSKIIHGRDLPEQAKLSRQKMEEKVEMEVMLKFLHKNGLQQSNKYKPPDESEWPRLLDSKYC